jgi:hypothetical protein
MLHDILSLSSEFIFQKILIHKSRRIDRQIYFVHLNSSSNFHGYSHIFSNTINDPSIYYLQLNSYSYFHGYSHFLSNTINIIVFCCLESWQKHIHKLCPIVSGNSKNYTKFGCLYNDSRKWYVNRWHEWVVSVKNKFGWKSKIKPWK